MLIANHFGAVNGVQATRPARFAAVTRKPGAAVALSVTPLARRVRRPAVCGAAQRSIITVVMPLSAAFIPVLVAGVEGVL
jgi:hypothetical protein